MINKDNIKICLIIAVVFILLSSPILWAQDAKFRGTVKDEQGNPESFTAGESSRVNTC